MPYRALLILAMCLTGCAYGPVAIREAPPGDLQLAKAQENIESHSGAAVRWGGTIVSVEASQKQTLIEIQERALNRLGEPTRQRPSNGRFLATIDEALDPEVYDVGRELTVSGTLAGTQTRYIGNEPKELPVVRASARYLWERYYAYSPRYHYPYYPRRYYPYYYFPYRGFHRFRHHRHRH